MRAEDQAVPVLADLQRRGHGRAGCGLRWDGPVFSDVIDQGSRGILMSPSEEEEQCRETTR